jgi:hypothetical protein
MRRYVIVGAVVGTLLPLAFIAYSVRFHRTFGAELLVPFPVVFLFSLDGEERTTWIALVIAVVLNGTLFAALGALICLAQSKLRRRAGATDIDAVARS